MQVTDTNVVDAVKPVDVARELTLGELAETIRSLKAFPSIGEIEDWFGSLVLRQRDYLPHRLFADLSYARNLIARSPFAELLLLCWRPGQRTPIHDHGGSIGVVLVFEGMMTETFFETAPEGHVRPYNTYRRGPGAITGADVPDIHQLLNLQPAGTDLVTLHCYAPPLTILNTYSQKSADVGQYREGYFSGGGGI
jgi:cysteine dioxygenase